MNSSAASRTAAPWWAGAVAGLLAAASGVAVGTAVAALMRGVPWVKTANATVYLIDTVLMPPA